jgi:hypothetical protein
LLARAEQEIFDSPLARARFDLRFVARLFADQRTRKADHNFRIWNLWNLVAWHACWLEGARRMAPTPVSAPGR